MERTDENYHHLTIYHFHSTRQGCVRFAPSVDVHEGARSHGDLDIAGVKAALSKHGRLLVRHLQKKGTMKLSLSAEISFLLFRVKFLPRRS